MHKDFYASGFLFHLSTQQILLQQFNLGSQNVPTWSLFNGIYLREETPVSAFQRIINSQLHIKIKASSIFPVYAYLQQDIHVNNAIFYAEVSNIETFASTKKATFAWFPFKQIAKLALSLQTRQDIIVGQRVINAHIRISLGERALLD